MAKGSVWVSRSEGSLVGPVRQGERTGASAFWERHGRGCKNHQHPYDWGLWVPLTWKPQAAAGPWSAAAEAKGTQSSTSCVDDRTCPHGLAGPHTKPSLHTRNFQRAWWVGQKGTQERETEGWVQERPHLKPEVTSFPLRQFSSAHWKWMLASEIKRSCMGKSRSISPTWLLWLGKYLSHKIST